VGESKTWNLVFIINNVNGLWGYLALYAPTVTIELDRNEKKNVSDLLEWNVLFGFVRNGTRCWRYGIQ